MSPSSTSSSKTFGWGRLVREAGRLLAVLLVLELAVRLEPVKTALSDALDPYENLLWYSDYMPAYRDQLQNGPHYDLWMAGSSYMMTSLHPQWIQDEIKANGGDEVTVQNYGLTVMTNLSDMAAVFDRWMFRLDQPRYMLIGIAIHNFLRSARQPSRARSSPMETTYIFPDSIDEAAAGWLFQNSSLYRYALLARNATFIPRERAVTQALPYGGFVESTSSFEGCEPANWTPAETPPGQLIFDDFGALDAFIEVIEARGIPVAVVNIPAQYCSIRNSFPSYADYRDSYLKAMAEHLRQRGIPFLDLDTRFYELVPENEQVHYYRDYNHPNIEGAKLFSQWTGEFVAEWLRTLSRGDA